MQKKTCLVIFFLLVFSLTIVLPAFAEGQVSLIVAESKVLPVKSVYRVAVADPKVADVVIVSDQEVILIGKGPGVTSLILWNKVGRATYRVKVLSQEVTLAREIQGTIGQEHVQVRMNNGTVVLEGRVKDQNIANRAERIAGAYGQKVVNLLQVEKPLRVMVQAQMVEINKAAEKSLGVNWGNYSLDSNGKIVLGNPGEFLFGQVGPLGQLGATGGGEKSLLPVYAQIQALESNNQAKVLSKPNILTLSGQKANFLVGGEIPVPVASDNNKIQVEWKEYGVKLEVEPVVDGLGNITAKVKPEVSTIDPSNGVKIGDLVIPALKTRRVETEIQLPDGGTLAIGGLLQRNEATIMQKVPLLGDIPIIGQLFRSKSFLSGETELVVLVTFKKV